MNEHFNIDIGKFGENYACKYLHKKGYKIIEQNYATKYGEIDIIAEYGDLLVFVEVKTRSENYMVQPALAVTKSKQTKIIKSAFCYIKSHKNIKQPRFDVIEIVIKNNLKKSILINHIENAFIQGGQYAAF